MGRHDNPEFKPLHDRLMNLLRALLPLFNSMRGWNEENFDEGLAVLEATVAKLKEQALQNTEPVFDFLPDVVQDKSSVGDGSRNVENI
uniref:Transposase n=1 Tax=Panagrellus redivivus TaxID=6233 RepID=A0A7E4VUY4_PANRE